MIFSTKINGAEWKFDLSKPFDISIPFDFNGEQVNAYGVEKANSKACEAGEIVGDTRRGGSCNFEQVKLIPHCNGTHAECVGHITNERISILDCLQDSLIPAILLSVKPVKATERVESYSSVITDNDWIITRNELEKNYLRFSNNFTDFAFIVRTLPNDKSKLTATYLEEIPPFFTTEAMEFINKIGARHLLCDLPSIDRIYDEGKLSNHRIFWNVEQEEFEINERTRADKTITELIYVPDEIADGIYLLNLQIAPFVAEASPARPILFPSISKSPNE